MTSEYKLNNPTAQKINEQLKKIGSGQQEIDVLPLILTRGKTPVELEEEAKQNRLANKYIVKL